MERVRSPGRSDVWRPKRWRYIVVDPLGKISFVRTSRLRKYHRIVGSTHEYLYGGLLKLSCRVFNFSNTPLAIRRVDEDEAFRKCFGLSTEDPEEAFTTRVNISGKVYDLVDDERVSFHAILSKRTGRPRALAVKIYKPERTLRKFVINL